MGISGMNNRVKTNLSLKNKSNKYRKAYFKQEINLVNQFEFNTPTEEDLLNSQKSNHTFLQKQKKKKRILLLISFFISIVFYFWLF